MRIDGYACAFAFLVAVLLPTSAIAYVGPGAGISLIGATIGLVVALGTAIGFVIIWPLRSLFRRRGREVAASPAEGRPGAKGP